jgi:enoyl-CoA hydratase
MDPPIKTMSELLVEEAEKGIFVITLNRPESLNSLNKELIIKLAETFQTLKENKNLLCVILTGNGNFFSSGVDLKTAFSVFSGPDSVGNQKNDPLNLLLDFPKPIIAALNGPAITGGFELVLACDIVICTEKTYFLDTHTKFGIIPSWGMTQKLSRLIGKHRANEISLFGEKISSKKALEWGLVNHVLKDKEEVIKKSIELAKQLKKKVPSATVTVKKLIKEGYQMNLKDALEFEKEIANESYKQMTMETFEEITRKLKSKI